MAQTIKLKRGTGSAAPAASDLVEGELAYAEDRSNNGASAKLYISSINSSSAEVIQTVGGKYYTDIVDAATDANTASKLVKRDGSGNFAAGTITANLTGNASGSSGSTTGNAATATALAAGRTIGMTGDVVWTSASFTGAGDVTGVGTLATVNSNVGQFGSATAIPVVTVNAKGLVTAVSTAALSAASVDDATALAIALG
jgi:hypothetical protein